MVYIKIRGSRKWMSKPEGHHLMVFCAHYFKTGEKSDFIPAKIISGLCKQANLSFDQLALDKLVMKRYLVSTKDGYQIEKMPENWKGLEKVTFNNNGAIRLNNNKKDKENKMNQGMVTLTGEQFGALQRLKAKMDKDFKVAAMTELYLCVESIGPNLKKLIDFFVEKGLIAFSHKDYSNPRAPRGIKIYKVSDKISVKLGPGEMEVKFKEIEKTKKKKRKKRGRKKANIPTNAAFRRGIREKIRLKEEEKKVVMEKCEKKLALIDKDIEALEKLMAIFE